MSCDSYILNHSNRTFVEKSGGTLAHFEGEEADSHADFADYKKSKEEITVFVSAPQPFVEMGTIQYKTLSRGKSLRMTYTQRPSLITRWRSEVNEDAEVDHIFTRWRTGVEGL